MTITTAQALGSSANGALNPTGAEIAALQILYTSSMALDAMTPLRLAGHTDYATAGTGGVVTMTAGYDPVVVVALSVNLRSVGQIWPITLLG